MSLGSSIRENVSVNPLQYDRNAEVRHVVGAWLPDGSLVEELFLRRGRKKISAPQSQTANFEVAGERVYGGIIMHHYGHFLFETLSRYWFLKSCDLRAVWHILPELPAVRRWQAEIFAMLGLKVEPSDLILQPTRFERLAIPQAGAELWTSLHPDQVEALAIFPFRKPLSGKRLWLSRSRKVRRGGVQDEQELETLLQASGWTVMQPETLAVRDQLAAMADAELIAGFDGSAFHSLMLGRDVAAKVVIVPRGGANKISPTYDIIAKAKGFSQTVVLARMAPVRGSGRGAVHRLEQPSELAKALNAF